MITLLEKFWKVFLKHYLPTMDTTVYLNTETFLLLVSLKLQISLALKLFPQNNVKQHSWLIKRRQHAIININCIASYHLSPPAWKWNDGLYCSLKGNRKVIGNTIMIYLLPLTLESPWSTIHFAFKRLTTSDCTDWSIKQEDNICCMLKDWVYKEKKILDRRWCRI